MGLNVKGEQLIFRNDREGRDGTWYSYTTYVSSKDKNGNWVKDLYEVVFAKDAKDTVLENKTKINITDGFLGCREYMNKNGDKVVVSQVIVFAFDEVSAGEPTGYTALTDDDLSF